MNNVWNSEVEKVNREIEWFNACNKCDNCDIDICECLCDRCEVCNVLSIDSYEYEGCMCESPNSKDY